MYHNLLLLSESQDARWMGMLRGKLYRCFISIICYRNIYLSLLFLTGVFSNHSIAQTTESNQFWTKYEFSHAFGNKWAADMDLTARFSDAPGQKSIFATRSQFSAQGWAHYHFSSRWRFSGAVAYYDNFYLPELGQNESKEWRFTLQGLYFFHKIGYTFTTRGTAEIRHINAADDGLTNAFRYRQRVKYQKPINSKSFRKGVFYALAADEVYFRVNSIKGQNTFFDRNRITLGGGYVLTDNIKLEMAYVNEFLLRSDGNEIVNALSLTITFNNLLDNIRQKLKNSKEN